MRFSGRSNGQSHAGSLPILCGLLTLGFSATLAVANDAPTSQNHIAGLVRQLGSPEFIQRQRASRELAILGVAAKEALSAAVDDPDAELRARAREALAIVTRADFAARLQAFEADYNGSRKHTLPGWERFSQRLGADPRARRLYIEMARREPDLLAAYSQSDRAATEALDARCNDLLTQAAGGESQFPLGTMATLLFVGSDEAVTVNEQVGVQLYTAMIYQPTFRKVARSGPSSGIMKQLLGEWIARDISSSATIQNLNFAAFYDLQPQGLALATKVLQSEPANARLRQFALLAIGRFGSDEHLPIVESHLDNPTTCGAVHLIKPPRQVDLQLRDVALAVSLHLTSQQPNEYGGADVQTDPNTLFRVPTLAFTSAGKRTAALERWAEWRARSPLP